MATRYLIGESSASLLVCLPIGRSSSRRTTEAAATLLRRTAADRSTKSQRRPFTRSATASEQAQENTASSKKSSGQIGAYLLLSRLPTILPTPTPFEAAYYAYNAKLHRALEQGFPRELYYKKGSAAETQFLADEAERKAIMRGAWRSEEADKEQEESNDGRVRVPQPIQSQQEEGQDLTSNDVALGSTGPNDVPFAFGIPMNGMKDQAIAPRHTKADESNDLLSLERKLDRTLFLVVKGASAGPSWTLPHSRMPKASSFDNQLHKVAPQSAYNLLGPNMDIWMVTNIPVGVMADKGGEPVTPTLSTESNYIMRAHILAGKPEPVEKDIEYAWLTREEMQERVDKELWSGVEDLLSA